MSDSPTPKIGSYNQRTGEYTLPKDTIIDVNQLKHCLEDAANIAERDQRTVIVINNDSDAKGTDSYKLSVTPDREIHVIEQSGKKTEIEEFKAKIKKSGSKITQKPDKAKLYLIKNRTPGNRGL